MNKITAYLKKRAITAPWRIDGLPAGRFGGAVVIPSLAESENLPGTLRSLAANPPELLQCYLIVVVVNHRCDASREQQADNRRTLERLPAWKTELNLATLCWVDAVSPGLELPPRQGVGLARKIGMDLALATLTTRGDDPLLVCLDADTTVQPDYLQALLDHDTASAVGGTAIPYRHRPASDPAGQEAIDRYELFLRAYVLGLELAGSPWAFHTVGSAMACRASVYAAAGGMNKRLAGEDFYFLQQVHKVSGVAPLTGTVVHPSPRSSWRVPFGTGRSVGDMLTDGPKRLMFYDPKLFELLGDWLAGVGESWTMDGAAMLACGFGVNRALGEFLQEAGFGDAWDGIRRNNPGNVRNRKAFHDWFDAFRTMRLMHRLTDSGFPRQAPELVLPPLLQKAGIPCRTTAVPDMLAALRRRQGA